MSTRIAVMGYGDGFAAIAGKGIKSRHFKIFGSDKSLAGSTTMFIISSIIIAGGMVYMNIANWPIKAILTALKKHGFSSCGHYKKEQRKFYFKNKQTNK